jgi:hypothetical protein
VTWTTLLPAVVWNLRCHEVSAIPFGDRIIATEGEHRHRFLWNRLSRPARCSAQPVLRQVGRFDFGIVRAGGYFMIPNWRWTSRT